VNRLEQTNPRTPETELLPLNQAAQLLKFILKPATATDHSRVPNILRPLPAMDTPVVRTREWDFDRTNGMWTVNGRLFDHNRIDAYIKRGTAEIWRIRTAGGWSHPVHIHVEEQRVLSYNGRPVTSGPLFARKDVFTLRQGDEMELYVRFRDWLGRYPMHCHNTVHEDHAMMVRLELVP
jgi:FtsP/CotA-like multicopper oxidase with cupredoxin domain